MVDAILEGAQNVVHPFEEGQMDENRMARVEREINTHQSHKLQ